MQTVYILQKKDDIKTIINEIFCSNYLKDFNYEGNYNKKSFKETNFFKLLKCKYERNYFEYHFLCKLKQFCYTFQQSNQMNVH